MLVADSQDVSSFEHLEMWIKEVKDNVKWDEIEKLVIVNKCDLESKITEEMKQAFTQTHGVEILEVSAKTGLGVADAFAKMSEKLVQH